MLRVAKKAVLSRCFRFEIDSDHRLSRSSSEAEPVQSSVAPPFEDDGTGCRGTPPTDGLKSISDSVLCVLSGGGAWGSSASLVRTGDEYVENDEFEAWSDARGASFAAKVV